MLHAPDAWVRTPLPEVKDGVVVVHCSPELGAGFLQYTAEVEAGGGLVPVAEQRFCWVLEGEIDVACADHMRRLTAGDYCYLPAGFGGGIGVRVSAKLIVIEKKYRALAGVAAPGPVFGREEDVVGVPLGGDEALLVRALLPGDLGFDFAVNTMTYEAGAALGQVEIHVMEHGLVMLEGEGTYRLGDEGYETRKGDFIWMAPYCPQWFVAEGDGPAKYLIYKDWNRRPKL
jgi:(S)-ureidoglycine aminohydrolase